MLFWQKTENPTSVVYFVRSKIMANVVTLGGFALLMLSVRGIGGAIGFFAGLLLLIIFAVDCLPAYLAIIKARLSGRSVATRGLWVGVTITIEKPN